MNPSTSKYSKYYNGPLWDLENIWKSQIKIARSKTTVDQNNCAEVHHLQKTNTHSTISSVNSTYLVFWDHSYLVDLEPYPELLQLALQ